MGNDQDKEMFKLRPPIENDAFKDKVDPNKNKNKEEKSNDEQLFNTLANAEKYRSGPALSETAEKYVHYLNFLYKNNFVSLNFDNLCAYLIQYRWRKFYLKDLRIKRKGMIDIIYSEFPNDNLTQAKQEQLFLILGSKKYPYRMYDVLTYKKLIKFVKENFGETVKYPYIFINGYYIGSTDEFQEIEDNKMVNKIIQAEYKNICLLCHVPKPNEELKRCPFCFQSYTHFAKEDEIYKVYENRK